MNVFFTTYFSQEFFMLQLQIIVRCLVSAICGAVIGIERKNRLKDAGMRTHLIVAMGSCLIMCISKYGFFDVLRYGMQNGMDARVDVSRLASSIVTGVGFLGAGTIFVRKQVINGLTTAAGIWTVSGIGMAIGAGLYIPGIAVTALLFVAQVVLHKDFKHLSLPVSELVTLRLYDRENVIKSLGQAFDTLNITVTGMKYDRVGEELIEVEAFVKLPNGYSLVQFAEDLKKYDFIKTLET